MIEILESAFAQALVVSAALYAFLVWLSKNHLSKEFKDDLGIWLVGGYARDWNKYYNRFFDAVFGHKHLSLECFLKSSLASLLAASATYYFLSSGFGVIGNRIPEQISWLDFLMLAVAVNLIPDYLSLYETRVVIGFLKREHSTLTHIAVLFFDLCISALIIVAYIFAFRYFMALEQLSFVEMAGLFSIYSIFFYSTFLTSIWAWLYVCSVFTVRLMARGPLTKVLNVWENPAGTIALLTSTYCFITVTLLSPLLERDEILQVTKFDEWLCSVVSSRACPHVFRLSNDEKSTLSLQIRLCEASGGSTCSQAGQSFMQAGETSRASSLFRAGCTTDDVRSCFLLSELEFNGMISPVGGGTFQEIASKACEDSYAPACARLGIYQYNGWGGEIDESKAYLNLRNSCEQGAVNGCTWAAWMVEHGRALGRNLDLVEKAYSDSCEQAYAPACLLLGESIIYGRFDEPDVPSALVFFEKACELGHPVSCRKSQEVSNFLSKTGNAKNLAEANTLMQCREGSALACLNIGKAYSEGQDLLRNPVAAAQFFDQSCQLGSAEACFRKARNYQLGDGVTQDAEKALVAFDETCNMGHYDACFETDLLKHDDLQDRSYFVDLITHFRSGCSKDRYLQYCLYLAKLEVDVPHISLPQDNAECVAEGFRDCRFIFKLNTNR